MTKHIPVLPNEVLEALNLKPGSTFLDGTVGGGGHSALVAEKLGSSVSIVALDRSKRALEISGERLRSLGAKINLSQTSFRNLDKVLEELEIPKVDAILLDLGISSDQLDESGRGFSFKKDEPLLMTMQEEIDENDLTAKRIVNEFDESTLELIIRGFGEEKYSRKIARAIVERRGQKKFNTTSDLLDVITEAVPPHHSRIHPATRTFQALRIATNEELIALEVGLEKGFQALNPGGRLAVISFHSLEDRMVKNSFRAHAEAGEAKIITKRPITPSENEIETNPRSRSAKLRVLEKI